MKISYEGTCKYEDDVMGFDAYCLLEKGHEGDHFYATKELIEDLPDGSPDELDDDGDEADYRE